MALSRKERNQVRKQIGLYLKQLDDTELSRKERNGLRKEIGLALKQLDAAIDQTPEGNPELDKLVAGDYNHLPPEEFLGKLKEITDALNGDIEPIKTPTVAYIEAKLEEGGDAILESVMAELSGEMDLDIEDCD